MKKSIKITTLAFAATLSTISAAIAAGVLCTNHFTQQNVDSINKQVYLDTVAPVSNDLSNTTGGLVKPTLNKTPVASYEGNQQSTTNVNQTLNSTPTSSQTSTAPVTTPVQNDTSSNVTNQETESSVESSDSSFDLASFFKTETMEQIFKDVNTRIKRSVRDGNHLEVTLKSINGTNVNSGYSLDDLYNTNIRVLRVTLPYTIKLNHDKEGKLTGNAHAEYDYNKVEVEYLDDSKVIGDCRTLDQKFEYFDGASYCYNAYNKANYRTIANNSELTINIDLPPVHNPNKTTQSTTDSSGTHYSNIYHTSGYIFIPKNWSNSIYKLANSRMPIDFKELISYGVKTSLFGSNEESRISIMEENLTSLFVRHDDGNADTDPINHWNDSWNQIIKDTANKSQKQ